MMNGSRKKCRLTLSANAGLSLEQNGIQLLFDALHCTPVPGFSSLSVTQTEEIFRHPSFCKPNMLFFTHNHPDHFSSSLTQRMLRQVPCAMLFLPEQIISNQIILSGTSVRYQTPEYSVTFQKLPHEGMAHTEYPHYGCLIECGGFRTLVTGDCAVATQVLADFLSHQPPVHLVILGFPWITRPSGRAFIQKYLPNAALAVCHLPFVNDDQNHYRALTQNALAFLAGHDIRLLYNFLQQEDFCSPRYNASTITTT